MRSARFCEAERILVDERSASSVLPQEGQHVRVEVEAALDVAAALGDVEHDRARG